MQGLTTSPAQNGDPLANLRDLHLPDAVSAWPPAPLWWVLTLLLLLACFYVGKVITQRKRARAYRVSALEQLNNAKENLDQQAYLLQCQQILRRAALQAYPHSRSEIAPLSATAWINFLDSCCSSSVFDEQLSTQIAQAHYQQKNEVPIDELHSVAVRWLKEHR